MDTNKSSDEGMKIDMAGKMPAVQGGDSEEEMPSNLRSDERLQFHAAGKRPAVQGGDSVEEMEMPSNLVSDDEAAVRRAIMRIVMQPGDQKERQDKLLKFVEEKQRQKQKVSRNLMQLMQSATEKGMLAQLLRHEEKNQPQKQENQPQKQEHQKPQKQEHQKPQKQESQPQKQNKKHHRKSRMALRKIAMEEVKKSNLEKPGLDDKEAAYLVARAKERAKERELEDEIEARNDWHAYQARLCRDRWNESPVARGKNTYETITSIPPMRFTDRVKPSASPCETLQIFSVKVAGIKEGVHWPLYVYGKVAVRDTVDRKRNIIFDRTRDNFQTVTEQDPYLTLTGPSRAAVLSVHHSYIEAELKIKGSSSDSDDKDFSYLAIGYIQTAPCESFITERVVSSRLSTLELTVGHIPNSVEATVSVEVSGGKWPSGYGGVFMVSTASMDTMKIVLLTFGDNGLPLEDDGKKVRLSRSVVGVEVDGSLNVAVKALPPGGSSTDELSDEKFFTPKESSRSYLELKVGSCEMKVCVAWSLLLTYDC